MARDMAPADDTLQAERELDMAELELLLAAIGSDDPKPELLLRVRDMIERKRRALTGAAT